MCYQTVGIRPISLVPFPMEMCDVSTLIYDSDPKLNCLSYARYVTYGLDVKVEAKYTLLVSSAALLNCKPLKCVM